MACEEAVDRAVAERETLGGKLAADLFNRGVGAERRQHSRVVRLDVLGAPVAA